MILKRDATELEKPFGKGWHQQFDRRNTMPAATAREYGLGLATRNTRPFPFCPTGENPFGTQKPSPVDLPRPNLPCQIQDRVKTRPLRNFCFFDLNR